MDAGSPDDVGLLNRVKQSPWIVALAVAGGALVPALLLEDGESFIGLAVGAAAVAAWTARRNDPVRQEPFVGDGYTGSWTTHPDYSNPPVMFVRVELESGEHCAMVSRLQGNAGALKLSSPGFTGDGEFRSGRGVGEKLHRVRRTAGGTIITSTRTGSDTFEVAIAGETVMITATKASMPAETAAQMAALTQELPPHVRVVAIAYAASQQFLWLK
jgi:hypothetical protein